MGELDDATLPVAEKVHYTNIALVLEDVHKSLRAEAWMLGTLGILVGMEIVAKEWYFNVPYSAERCGDLTCYREFATQKSGQIFKEGLEAMSPVDSRTTELLWKLRIKLAHAFTLAKGSKLDRYYAPETQALMDDTLVSRAAVAVEGDKATFYIPNLERILGMAYSKLLILSETPGWQDVHDVLVVE